MGVGSGGSRARSHCTDSPTASPKLRQWRSTAPPKAELGERRRQQRRGRAADLVERFVDVTADRVDRRGIAGATQRQEAQARCGQRLPGAVVQVARDAAAIVLLQHDRQLPHQRRDAPLRRADGTHGHEVQEPRTSSSARAANHSVSRAVDRFRLPRSAAHPHARDRFSVEHDRRVAPQLPAARRPRRAKVDGHLGAAASRTTSVAMRPSPSAVSRSAIFAES